jgi:hypothetical protein
MLGDYEITGNGLRFVPRFPLRPGVLYEAVFTPASLSGRKETTVVARFRAGNEPTGPAAVIEHVYPTASELPENLLKFYIHFSAPMSWGGAYRHVHLLDSSAREIELPFLELDEELWDPQRKRFTLFFDPGRIKRGLKPREEVGPALEEGKSYTLVIDRDWLDAQGRPLKEAYRKRFRVTPPEDRPVNPKEWRVNVPAAGSLAPLVVRFSRPLDHALLEHVFRVLDSASQHVAGTVSITEAETCWVFTPQRRWEAGNYQLEVETVLEDVAGNRIGRPFEVDVFRQIEPTTKSRTFKVPFILR